MHNRLNLQRKIQFTIFGKIEATDQIIFYNTNNKYIIYIYIFFIFYVFIEARSIIVFDWKKNIRKKIKID